ncbi:MAG: hypothetical protein ACYC9R_12755 [Nitrosotalea sp.]
MISKSDFQQWKNSEAYKELYKDLTDNMAMQASEMVTRMEPDPIRDTYLRGIMAGWRVVLEWEPTFVKDGEEDEV